MISEAQLESALRELFDRIEFTSEPAGLYDPLRYMIGIGGKRVRPRMCLLAWALYRDEFTPEILEPAAALEVFHSFTLIHDDIMDNADVRRGVPTVCRKWDDNTAILSGDVMCIDSYRRIAKAPAAVLPQVMELFTTTAAQVCDGQQYDMDFEDIDSVSMDDYMKMIGLKTAVLIACSFKMGALIAGAPAEECELLYKFGYDLGLAFQVTDDYLDTFGDPAVFGKAIGGDILNAKKTWLYVKAMSKAQGQEAADLRSALLSECRSDAEKAEKIAEVTDMYLRLGVDEDAKYEILGLHNRALEYASALKISKVRMEMLQRYAGRLIGRTK